MQSNRNGQGADEDLSSKPAELFFRLAPDAENNCVIPAPCSGMIQSVPAHEEDFSKFFVVVRHHCWAGSLLGHVEEVVDVLDRPEGFLPKLQLDGGVELGKSGVEMVLQGVWVGEVDRVLLV